MDDVPALPSESTSSVEPQETVSSADDRLREPSVSVIIPTYNERTNIRHVIDRCLDAVSMYSIEILVVDDDSPDGTWRLVSKTYRDDDRITVLRRTDETGLATAVSLGFREAVHDICVVLDADLQHPPERIPEVIEAFTSNVDLVVGSRMHEDGGIEDWSPFRSLVSSTATRLTQLLVPPARDVTDPMSGFFAVRRSRVAGVDLDPLGYKIFLEVLVRADIGRVVEVPYTFHDRERGDSKLTAGQYLRFVEHNLKLGLESRDLWRVGESKRFGRNLEACVIGGLGVLVHVVVFVLALSVGALYLVAGLFAFLATANTNVAGARLFTDDRPGGSLTRQYPRVHAFLSGGFLLYLSVLVVLIEGLRIPWVAASLLAIVVSSISSVVGTDHLRVGETR